MPSNFKVSSARAERSLLLRLLVAAGADSLLSILELLAFHQHVWLFWLGWWLDCGSLFCAMPGLTVDTCSASVPWWLWRSCPDFLRVLLGPRGRFLSFSPASWCGEVCTVDARVHVEIETFYEPFVSCSSAFAVRVLPEKSFFRLDDSQL